MDWIDKWNEALEMLEKSLTVEISLDDIARTACCTTFHFQRMFSYLADMPLSEYIRRRKMTKAAFDLQRGAKVIDVALKYGYRSPTAFTRAFQSIHGITPSQAKAKGAPLKAFPPIRFQMTVKGVTALDYRMEAKSPAHCGDLHTTGKRYGEKFPDCTCFLAKSCGRQYPAETDKHHGNACGARNFRLSGRRMEILDWRLHFQRSGTAPGNAGTACCHMGNLPRYRSYAKGVSGIEKRIFTEWLPNSGYEYGKGADIEVYYNADPADSVFEIWIPVVKKAEHI